MNQEFYLSQSKDSKGADRLSKVSDVSSQSDVVELIFKGIEVGNSANLIM